jgi:hypothetical protein
MMMMMMMMMNRRRLRWRDDLLAATGDAVSGLA